MNKRFLISISLLILFLNSSCFHLQHTHLYPKEVIIDDNSNFRMVVNAPGSKMRFLVDGKEVCSDRMVRNKVLEICIRVEEGKHTLRVETTDGKLSAESEFTIGKETLWAYIRYAPVQQDNDETTPSSAKKGELLITISKRFPYGIA